MAKAWKKFRDRYKSLVKSRGGSSAAEKVLVDTSGRYYLDFPEVWQLAYGCSSRKLSEVVPEKEHRHVFFHVELVGDTATQARRVRHPDFASSVVRHLHAGLKKQLRKDAPFCMYWSKELLDYERWVCTNMGACWAAYNSGRPKVMTKKGKAEDELLCPHCENEVTLEPWCSACDQPRDDDGKCHGTCGVRDTKELGVASSEGAELRRDLKVFIEVRVSGVVVNATQHENLRHGCAVHLNGCFDAWDFLTCIAPVEKARTSPIVGPVVLCVDQDMSPVRPRGLPRIFTTAKFTHGLRLDQSAFRAHETAHFQHLLRESSAAIKKGQFRKPTEEFEARVLSKLPLALADARVETAWSAGEDKPGFRCYFVKEGSTCPTGHCAGGGRFEMLAFGAMWHLACLRCKRKLMVEGGGINANILRDMLWQQPSRKDENDARVDSMDLVGKVGLGDFRDAFFTYRHDVHENFVPLFCQNIRKRRKRKQNISNGSRK